MIPVFFLDKSHCGGYNKIRLVLTNQNLYSKRSSPIANYIQGGNPMELLHILQNTCAIFLLSVMMAAIFQLKKRLRHYTNL